ncbi:type II secretion system F family protein [Virgibacillus sp. C22-A2]|uniref:Type II secretion system F family protein n=1 Tax=Virgibacillus tibetensis TaxID=3042313 RepID=A0ABU6KEW2_9BACI|nr:type II secretion system F family protein [Virgibacillus sp. C22-A2]
MLALYTSFFIFICLISYAVIGMQAERKGHINKRIQSYFVMNTPNNQLDIAEEESTFFERVVQPVWTSLTRKYNKRLGREEKSKLESTLLQAGEPFGLGPVEFKLAKTVLLIVIPLFGILYGLLLGLGTAAMLLVAVLGSAVGIFLPNCYLKMKIKKRSRFAGRELPEILDLLTMSLEAGLGFDAALSQLVSKKKGEIIREFKICLEEMRLGKTRKEALNAINDRLVSEELRSLIYNIVQAEKLGIGMVSVLRVQTEDIREFRRQKAEESAMKAPIKMMFPLVLFIFPTLFIILLGPAMLQLLEAF